MKIIILGCGPSTGVPTIGGRWGKCNPTEPKNRRLRASLLLQHKNKNILFDTSPDIREQLLKACCQKIDAVFFTHSHADHTHGINDLRTVNRLMQKPIPIYGDSETIADIKKSFSYIFRPSDPLDFYKPSLIPHIIDGDFHFDGIAISSFIQCHGLAGKSLGYRIGNFAYSTDVVGLDDKAFETLQNLDIWVVDCLQVEPHITHAHLDKTLSWIEKLKPKKALLTHMNESLDYHKLQKILPQNVHPAYDGQEISMSEE